VIDRTAVEADTEMEIQLLGFGKAPGTAGVD
jgi:hypothetical protein